MRQLVHSIDVGRLILAILLALGLWMVVQNEQNPERSQLTEFQVPVDVVGISEGFTMVSDQPQVQLWVRATENVWPQLRRENFTASVDASGATTGPTDLQVQVQSNHPLVRQVEPRPDKVRVRLDEIRERTVPVRVQPEGSVPFGYSFTTPKVSPEMITVVGPESQVERVEAAVVRMEMRGVTVSVNGSFAPRAVDTRGAEVKGVQFIPAQVAVDIGVNQEVAYKEVGIRPSTTGKLPPGYYMLPLEVDPPVATVVGHPDMLSKVSLLETESVDVSDVSSSVVRRTTVKLPSGVSLLQPQLSVLVTVRVQPLEVTQTIRLLPTVEGLGRELSVSSELPLIELAVSGPAPTLQALNPSDFKVTINLSDLEAGRHVVQPRAIVPGSFTLERLEPRSFSIEIEKVSEAERRPAAAIGP